MRAGWESGVWDVPPLTADSGYPGHRSRHGEVIGSALQPFLGALMP
jgi:hypothetical protein